MHSALSITYLKSTDISDADNSYHSSILLYYFWRFIISGVLFISPKLLQQKVCTLRPEKFFFLGEPKFRQPNFSFPANNMLYATLKNYKVVLISFCQKSKKFLSKNLFISRSRYLFQLVRITGHLAYQQTWNLF